ncbi:hypothetical protein MASR1M36_19670 [Candidatus Cloacimonadaceae bacterium]
MLTAISWFEKATQAGHAKAAFAVGEMYCNGKGVAVDYNKALKYWKMAADQNDTTAQFNIGAMYYQGLGVNESKAESYFWMLLASSYGNGDAVPNVVHLTSRLSETTKNAMQERVTEWINNHDKTKNPQS